MKLTFKDLKQQKFVIEAEPSETVQQLKEKISAEKGWEATQQKLIYSGKILKDVDTIGSYNVEEKGFIVCMVSKVSYLFSLVTEYADPSKAKSSPRYKLSNDLFRCAIHPSSTNSSDTCSTCCTSACFQPYVRCPSHAVTSTRRRHYNREQQLQRPISPRSRSPA